MLQAQVRCWLLTVAKSQLHSQSLPHYKTRAYGNAHFRTFHDFSRKSWERGLDKFCRGETWIWLLCDSHPCRKERGKDGATSELRQPRTLGVTNKTAAAAASNPISNYALELTITLPITSRVIRVITPSDMTQ